MANFNCSPDCITATNVPISFEKKCTPQVRKTYGFPYYALVKKGFLQTFDPSILANWETAIAAGDIQLSPCGKFELGTPTFTTSTDTNNCGITEILETIYQPTFTTYGSDPDGLTHCDYWAALTEEECLDIIFFDCADNVIVNPIYRKLIATPAINNNIGAGLQYSLIQAPYVDNGDANKERTNVQFEIKLDGKQILCPVEVPGLLDALKNALPA